MRIALLLLDIELFFAINKLYPVVVLIIISMIIYATFSKYIENLILIVGKICIILVAEIIYKQPERQI